MRLLGQFQTSFFFFTKRFHANKNANQIKTNQQNEIKRRKNNEGNNFWYIIGSRREKILWFWFDLRFCKHKIFSLKKKKKKLV